MQEILARLADFEMEIFELIVFRYVVTLKRDPRVVSDPCLPALYTRSSLLVIMKPLRF